MTSRFTFSCLPQLVVVCGRESSCPELCLGRGTSPQTLTLFSHLGLNMTISQHAQIPLQLLLHYQSATGLNNNALSPQACNNTCWRDQQLASASINQGPRVLFDAENGPKVLFNTGSANPTQIHPIQPCPFCSPSMHFCLFLSVHLVSASFSRSLLGHFDAEKTGFCGCGKLRPAYEVWDEYRVHQGQCQGLNASQLCGMGVRWLRSCVRELCIPERLRECWLTITEQTSTPH